MYKVMGHQSAMSHRLSGLGGRLMVVVVDCPSLPGRRLQTEPHRAQNILLIRCMAGVQLLETGTPAGALRCCGQPMAQQALQQA